MMEGFAIPYCGPAPAPDAWLDRWNGDPMLLLCLAAAGILAARRRDVGTPFWASYFLVALLFVSPLCALSSSLFSIRVAHHVLLTAAAAPLLAWGLPALRPPGSAALWTAAHILFFWFWHAPGSYAAALASDTLFWAMQISLLTSAVAVWSHLRTSSAPTAIALLLAMMVQMGLLGALITFAGTPLYAPHYLTTQDWGLSPLEDQQLAGLLMWAPAAGFYLVAALCRGWTMLAPSPSPVR